MEKSGLDATHMQVPIEGLARRPSVAGCPTSRRHLPRNDDLLLVLPL